jgi:DNA-directed RNA polymerase
MLNFLNSNSSRVISFGAGTFHFKTFYSSALLSHIDHNQFMDNHQRKLILSTISLSNQANPVIYTSISGVYDNFDINFLSQRKDSFPWTSVNVISKLDSNYSNYYAKDLGLVFKDNKNVYIFNLTLIDLIDIIKGKDINIDVCKEIINSGVFIFEGYDWSEIVDTFLKEGIIITGGLGTKRHIISPTHFRLMKVLFALDINFSLLSYYYNHVSYLLTKDKNSFVHNKSTIKTNIQSKRSYSTSTNLGFKERSYSSDINYERKSFLFDYSPVFMGVEEIFKSNKSPYEKQQEIEKLLNDSWFNLYINNLGSSEFNKEYVKLLSTHIINFSNSLSIYLQNIKNKKLKHLEPLLNLPVNVTSLIIFKVLFPVLFRGEEINKTTLIIKIGKNIFTRWSKEEYNKIRLVSSEIEDYSTYKDNLNFSDKEFLNIGDLVFNIILNNNPIFHVNIDNSDPLNTKLMVSPEIKVREMFERKLEIIGFKLPMVCPPVKWSKDCYGGYLNNNNEYEPLIKPSRKSGLKTKYNHNKEDIFNSVNYMSQIPYCINKDVLNFILDNYQNLGLKSNLHPLTSKYYSFSYKNKSEIETHNSLFYLQKNIIGLAKLLTNIEEFYFPIELDWRGRIYCQSNYITFQGNELAKSLILFKNGKTLNNNGLYYLKVYGANLYGIDKESFKDRIKWVENNHQNILNMDLNFILKASEPIIFIAFCFEYRNYINNPDNFISRLPIMLDASCNGLQHLSAMVGENTIAKNVNLLESDPNIRPNDFYQFCLDLINKKLIELSTKNSMYIRLSKINLTRAIIKRSIMTVPYNVTKIGISLQLEEYFDWVKVDNQNLLKPKWHSEDSNIYINKKELYALSELIHNTLYDEHPLLKGLVKYLTEIAELLFKLGLPIIWNTPSGLIVKQKYNKFKKLRVKASLSKSSTYTILVPTDEIDLSKQKAGFMPNLIHSMDASNICLMINYLIKDNHYINLFTVHDCFASTADSIQTINIVVRLAFLKLYSDSKYLNKLHNFYCEYIIDNGFIIDNNIVYNSSGDQFNLPTPPISNNLDLNNVLNKAIYFIN